MDEVIQVQELTKDFGQFRAVNQVSFTVQAGEVVGYLGPNGCGKTTTIRMLLGLLRPTSGSANVLGIDILRDPEAVRRQVGYMSQKFALYHDLSVWENLQFYAGIYGVRDITRINQVLKQIDLQDQKHTLVRTLSTGWRQRLALGTAIIHSPRLIFLDEPTSGVDPGARRAFWDLIYILVEQGMTAFVTTHYMDEAEYCGRVGIMRDGQLLAMDLPSQLKKNSIQGITWEIRAEPLLNSLAALEASPLVKRVRLSGDHLSALTHLNTQSAQLQAQLSQAGCTSMEINQVEPTLEDVFLALSAG